jgi:hypothetical protein
MRLAVAACSPVGNLIISATRNRPASIRNADPVLGHSLLRVPGGMLFAFTAGGDLGRRIVLKLRFEPELRAQTDANIWLACMVYEMH